MQETEDKARMRLAATAGYHASFFRETGDIDDYADMRKSLLLLGELSDIEVVELVKSFNFFFYGDNHYEN